MATKKKFKKLLKVLVNTMPTVTRLTHEDHLVKGQVLIDQGHTDDGKGGKIDPEKMYKQAMPVIISRNHEKRLKKRYSTHGRDGISSYVKEINKMQAEQNAENKTV